MAAAELSRPENKPRSLFDLSPDFFDSSCLVFSDGSSTQPTSIPSATSLPATSDDALTTEEARGRGDVSQTETKGMEVSSSRWTCKTCRAEFESLLDQRSHFKSDLHRLNVISLFRVYFSIILASESNSEGIIVVFCMVGRSLELSRIVRTYLFFCWIVIRQLMLISGYYY